MWLTCVGVVLGAELKGHNSLAFAIGEIIDNAISAVAEQKEKKIQVFIFEGDKV